MNLKDLSKKLERFGISENQGKIYLTLIQHGELRIQEISNLTQIPRSSVYENLKTLSDLGLIEKIIESKFVKIKPYPIASLKHKLNEKVFQTQKLIDDIGNIEEAIKTLPDKNSIPSTTVRYYKGISGGQQLFWNTLNAKGIVYVYSAYGRSKFVGKKYYKNFVERSGERNIKEQVIINPTQRALSLIKRDTGTSLARTKVKDLRFLPEADILIKGETFIYNNIYAQINLSTSGINGFEIESNNFSDMQRSIFETLYKNAKPISGLL